MVKLRRVLLIALALILLIGAWLWWNRPRQVDMAAYVPADSLIYIEANSLTELARGVVSTDAWQALAPVAGVPTDLGQLDWMSRLSAWTGIGSADAVVLTRAQVAISLLGFDAAEEETTTLKISPRVALVVETHTGESRARAAVEKLIGDFARRAYGSPKVEHAKVGEIFFVTWSSPSDEGRKIIAAVEGSVAVVGNDRGAVEACLAAKRGERPSLSGDAQIEEMRERMDAAGSLAFGYLPSGSAAKLLEVAAVAYVGQAVASPQMQSIVASTLPQLANKLLGNAAWSTRIRDGAVEDNYFLALGNGLGSRLSEALAPTGAIAADGAVEFLPEHTYQFTRYAYRDPETAWRGFNAALLSQVDALAAPLLGRLLEELLKPYGIEEPREFLRAAGPELATARLDDGGESTVLIVGVRDREVLQKQLRKHLGAGARSVEVGDVTMSVSADDERGAASFVGEHLIMGQETNVRRCLEARAQGTTLAASDNFKQAAKATLETQKASVATLTDDQQAALAFVSYFAPKRFALEQSATNSEQTRRKLARRAYAVSESRFIPEGYERQTRSSFGNFGTLVSRFAPDSKSN